MKDMKFVNFCNGIAKVKSERRHIDWCGALNARVSTRNYATVTSSYCRVPSPITSA